MREFVSGFSADLKGMIDFRTALHYAESTFMERSRQFDLFCVKNYPKATVVDTTGAGDNFASGFLSFIMEGKSLKEASQFANCAASLAIEKIGATTGITSRALADERYADYLQELAKQD